MSYLVQKLVLQSKLPGITKKKMQAKLMLVAMAQFTDDHGAGAFPAVETLAQRANCSDRSVQRLLKELLEAGLLIQQAPAQQHRPTTYRINVAGLGVPGHAESTLNSRGTSTTPLVTNSPAIPVSGVTETPLRGDKTTQIAPPGVTQLSPDRTYGNSENVRTTFPKNARAAQDAQTVAEQAYDQLTTENRHRLEQDARRELAGLLSLQKPERATEMVKRQVQLYLRDPRVRQEFLGRPPAGHLAACG
ncbi:MAG: helix-turn-helix domain-containing protein [Gammaproteobacteria bacterium]